MHQSGKGSFTPNGATISFHENHSWSAVSLSLSLSLFISDPNKEVSCRRLFAFTCLSYDFPSFSPSTRTFRRAARPEKGKRKRRYQQTFSASCVVEERECEGKIEGRSWGWGLGCVNSPRGISQPRIRLYPHLCRDGMCLGGRRLDDFLWWCDTCFAAMAMDGVWADLEVTRFLRNRGSQFLFWGNRATSRRIVAGE